MRSVLFLCPLIASVMAQRASSSFIRSSRFSLFFAMFGLLPPRMSTDGFFRIVYIMIFPPSCQRGEWLGMAGVQGRLGGALAIGGPQVLYGSGGVDDGCDEGMSRHSHQGV